jgi:hypothetical protein
VDMSRKLSRRDALGAGALAASVGLAGCLDALSGPSPTEQVREHEDALDRFSDVAVAVEEGYRTAATYVRDGGGVVGIPFVNPEVTELRPEQPGAVLYGLTESGQYEPFGLKWFAPTDDHDSPPTLFGTEFSGPHEGVAGLVPEHYALHVWLFRDNPDGLFATYNTDIDPPSLVDEVETVRTALSDYLVGREAEQNGYRNTEQCVSTGDGGYGVAFVREDTDWTGGTEPGTPPILLYGLTRSWTYQLLGAEWYVPAADADEAPTLFGQRFHEPAEGHSPETEQPSHYGLHAWLFGANPRGMFAPLNPAVSC